MYKFWLTVGVASLFLVGCADSALDSEKREESDEIETVQEKKAGDATSENQEINFTVTEPEGSVQNQNAAVPSAGLNPAHGQPGHDCAIPVGAPLDGSGSQNQVTTLPTISQPIAQPSVQPATAANGLNPAHGQPGHDCAVAVGAPLPAK